MICKRPAMRGKNAIPGTYELSLPLSTWRELDDYAVWKRKQAVPISKCVDAEEPDDDERPEVSRDAVRLTKRPQTARPGRALRAMKIDVGVRGIVCVNKSESVNATYEVLVQPGGMIHVETNYSAAVAMEAVPESKPAMPAKGRSAERHPLWREVVDIFTPTLTRCGTPLLSMDEKALRATCAELGQMPIDFLRTFFLAPRGKDRHNTRESRGLSGPLACVAVVREARLNWAAGQSNTEDTTEKDGLLRTLGYLTDWKETFGQFGPDAGFKRSLAATVNDPDCTADQQNAARRLLEILK